MKTNGTKAKLLAGELVFGLGLDAPDPMMVEYAAIAGLDFFRIDCEQGPFTLHSVEHVVRAAEAAGITATARVPVNRPEVVLQLLNRGIAGLTFPHISTPEDAAAAVSNTKFSPDGDRAISSAGGRGMHARWALGLSAEEAFTFANRETMVVCLIEDPVGIQNIEAIAAVPGVDVITFGSGDLAATMGLLGQFDHPKIREMISSGIRRATAAGKPVGISIGRSIEQAEEYVELGVRMIQMLPAPLFTDAIDRVRTALTT